MYARRYGLIETLAPLHVGASAGEEAGNLNLIFRDAYTQTGMIPGSSIRGRFRAEARRADPEATKVWFGAEAANDAKEFSEALVKFEYASLVWLPVFSPGQPVVWVSSPRLLDRYRRVINDLSLKLPAPYTASPGLRARDQQGGKDQKKTLFFNLGFMQVEPEPALARWIPKKGEKDTIPKDCLVVVDDADIGAIHDMALYRQSRVKLADNEKKVDGRAFFNVEALPEGSVLVFPIGIRPPTKSGPPDSWEPFGPSSTGELYFGGLESIGFGRCNVTLFDEEVG
ncbi:MULTISPECIES: RAMP superfamily CRISPR-associated protein [unclassified Synechococcus]|uniref:RAMP superfamily CRISPR-associated protein n=1 Tax=unclassified Synechococcus TaxID=2626047 RepID=UPI0021A9218F|nr:MULTISPECIES: RAMP superfamily CRISPR-associated protein [unclassified Synechococcus]MCT0212421.1 type III-B CRISPR module RAMP protein Cmr4 [Synechococcus sp. CS-1326]MCT0234604.1 type III-B CRISPR module RAMP protein Cmr4 [Synechococcus sp. CS-1327]